MAKRLSYTLILVAVFLSAAMGQTPSPGQAGQGPPLSGQPAAGPSPALSPTTPANTRPSDTELKFLDAPAVQQGGEAPSTRGLMVKTAGALLIVLGLVVGAGFVVRRFGGARFGAARDDAPELAVLVSVGLGERRSLAVVKFGEKTLLVGATNQSITLLASEDEPQAAVAAPRPRSVAEILSDANEPEFEDELLRAGGALQVVRGRWRAAGGRM